MIMRSICINQTAINLREFLENVKTSCGLWWWVGDTLILASSCSNKSNVQIGVDLTEMNFCLTRAPTSYLPAHFSFSTVEIKYRCLWHSIKFVTGSNNIILISLAEFKGLNHAHHGSSQVQVQVHVAAIWLCSTKWRSLIVIYFTVPFY